MTTYLNNQTSIKIESYNNRLSKKSGDNDLLFGWNLV